MWNTYSFTSLIFTTLGAWERRKHCQFCVATELMWTHFPLFTVMLVIKGVIFFWFPFLKFLKFPLLTTNTHAMPPHPAQWVGDAPSVPPWEGAGLARALTPPAPPASARCSGSLHRTLRALCIMAVNVYISLGNGAGAGWLKGQDLGISVSFGNLLTIHGHDLSLSTATTFPVHKKRQRTNLAFSFQFFVLLKKLLYMHHTVSKVCKLCLLCQQVVQGKLNLQDTLEQSRNKPMSTHLEIEFCYTGLGGGRKPNTQFEMGKWIESHWTMKGSSIKKK